MKFPTGSMLRACFCLLATAVIAQDTDAQDEGDRLALTFAYDATGTQTELADGYREHLEWHVEREDPTLWYAWFVVGGERLGQFVDGAFDVTGAQFDARPDPTADAADAVRTFAPFATAKYRRVYRLREDLSTATFLEDRSPSPLMQVIYYSVTPGRQQEFEAAARNISDGGGDATFTIYELLSGADLPLYVMLIPLNGFSGFDYPVTSLESAATQALGGTRLQESLRRISVAAHSSRAEIWQYRSDLSLIPH